ncbi:MAG: sodium:calcium antiporter [Propionibacteriaceae bacterium]
MFLHIVILLVCAVVIYVACEWFLNAVEWLGASLKVGAIAVGSILAAIGTALPESLITIMALVVGREGEKGELAMGAALGGPLVVSTVAYSVAGFSLWYYARQARKNGKDFGGLEAIDRQDTWVLSHDQLWFIFIFLSSIVLGLLPAFPGKRWFGLVYFAIYGYYFWRELKADDDTASAEGLEPLRFDKNSETPSKLAIWGQTLVTLVAIFAASHFFVAQLDYLGPKWGMPAIAAALLLSPVASELPETLNAYIWARDDKVKLALANVAGSMMIQSTIPAGITMIVAGWQFTPPALFAAIATMGCALWVHLLMRFHKLTPLRLGATLVFYIGFAIALVLYLV